MLALGEVVATKMRKVVIPELAEWKCCAW